MEGNKLGSGTGGKDFIDGARKKGYYKILKVVGMKVLLSMILAMAAPLCSWANDRGRVILIAMDRVSLEEIEGTHTPNIDRLVEMGGIGLMTSNTGGVLNQNNAYLTMGTGARVTGLGGSQEAYAYGERYRGVRIEELIYQMTGYRMEEGSIANPAIAKLHRSNSKRPYGVEIGALGEGLREARIGVAILGNADNHSREDEGIDAKSYLTSMFMDHRGIVPRGKIDHSLLMNDPTRPMGIMMDYERLYSSYLKLREGSGVIGIELGDTSRAEDFRSQAMDYRAPLHKKKALEASDGFIGRVLSDFDFQRDLLILISPVGPAEEIGRNNRLTPIIMVGQGIEAGSWLTSGSTHREGIVNNLDVGISILDFFGLSPSPEQGGAPIYNISGQGGFKGITDLNNRLVLIYNQRPILIRGYVYGLIILLTLSILILLYRRRYLKLVGPIQIFIMVIPLVYLILPLVQQSGLYMTILMGLSMALIFTLTLCRFLNSNEDRLMALSAATLIALLGDQWFGMKLIQSSPLGYDVIAGARFYGLGNEYMGVAIGSMSILMASTAKKLNDGKRSLYNWIPALWGLITLYTMVSPRLGANVGGTIATFAAFIAMVLLLRDKKVRLRDMVAISSAIVLLLELVFYADSLRAVDSQSHMGRTALAIKERGPKEVVGIINRKVSMNLRLFKTTIWTKVFLSSLGAIALLLFRPVGIFRDVYVKHRLLIKGLIGITIGSIAALLFNDSGIVAGATAMIFGAPVLILLVTHEIRDSVESGVWEDGE